jgi:threonine dehydrogenase-like Zn-dependent dehydrogenase
MTEWELRVDDVADPVPGPGQVLTRVLACGICGSDLHMLRYGAELRRLTEELEADGGAPPDPMRPIPFEPHTDTVMGHEFCCEVVEVGQGVENVRPGQIVVSMPVVFDADGLHAVGYSNRYPGGYGELLVLNELMAVPVPGGVPPALAALTEPLAVGVHAVNKSRIASGDAAIVLGLGPVGLACVAELKQRGIGPVVGADYSSRRRALAEHLGCDVVVDPRHERAIDAWRRIDGSRPLVIFEAVGMPGMIEQAMRSAPKDARVLVVGVCMQEDHFHPMLGIGRELSIQFALAYEPLEFAAALRSIAEGAVDLAPLVTGTVDIDGVPAAFEALADPDEHAKIVVRPA